MMDPKSNPLKVLDSLAAFWNAKDKKETPFDRISQFCNSDILSFLLQLLEDLASVDVTTPISVNSLKLLQFIVHLTVITGVYTQLPSEVLSDRKRASIPPQYLPSIPLAEVYQRLLKLVLFDSLVQKPLSLHLPELLATSIVLHLERIHKVEGSQNSLDIKPSTTEQSHATGHKLNNADLTGFPEEGFPLSDNPAMNISMCLQILLPKAPQDFKDIVTRILTKSICAPEGVKAFLAVFMQPDPNSVDRAKKAASLITSVPSFLSTEAYFDIIFPQLWTLMKSHSRLASYAILSLLHNHAELCETYFQPYFEILKTKSVVDISPVEEVLSRLDALLRTNDPSVGNLCVPITSSLFHLFQFASVKQLVLEILTSLFHINGVKSFLNQETDYDSLLEFLNTLSQNEITKCFPAVLEEWVESDPQERIKLYDVLFFMLSKVDTDLLSPKSVAALVFRLSEKLNDAEFAKNSLFVVPSEERAVQIKEKEDIVTVLLQLLSTMASKRTSNVFEEETPRVKTMLRQYLGSGQPVICELARDILQHLGDSQDDYRTALSYLHSEDVPTRGEGVYILRKLVENDSPKISPIQILQTFINLLRDEDSYVHLNVISGLVSLSEKYDNIVPILLQEYANSHKHDTTERLLLGQAIYQTMERLGELVPKFYSNIENACVSVIDSEETELQVSALNIASLLLRTRDSDLLIAKAVDILNLKAEDSNKFQRRAAIQVISESKHLNSTAITALKYISQFDGDDFVRNQAAVALQNGIERNVMYLE
ncbi:eukaryotic protein [Schizosaccharomyces japonicus yFS275]|uniref:Eukaryotic protein n=1 Tax=Schizosaccharomyces japonicus (strain yFS275 / FY16936) TaxID=402676 RepID=B6K0D5_SCHJY|nr:eukaryotic protein [Schizosaccharomyces japonicus yFS275]EEB06285.2 eukaryotic protein [Schizosaccharomyces japonicus yFS275]